jgi:hypothetical protein
MVTLTAQVATNQEEQAYLEVLKNRSDKILDDYVQLPQGATREKVRSLMVKQYWDLNKVHDATEAKVKELKKQDLTEKELNKEIEQENKKATRKLKKLQKRFLANLAKELNNKQINGVKEGMTLGALSHNYRGFTEMIPSLSDEEKSYIYNELLKARDEAMTMGSSEDKLNVFRKYKGRINNWLSAERGYDLKKEGEAWRERIK